MQRLKPMHVARVRAELHTILESGPADSEFGVCFHMANALPPRIKYDYTRWAKQAITDWYLYTGDRTFPVPHPGYRNSPCDGYICAANVWVGEYGHNRRMYIGHLLMKLEVTHAEA
jgi:hypothetical protein